MWTDGLWLDWIEFFVWEIGGYDLRGLGSTFGDIPLGPPAHVIENACAGPTIKTRQIV